MNSSASNGQSPLHGVRGLLLCLGLFAAMCLASVPLSIWVLTRGPNNRFYSDVLFPGILAAGFVVLLLTIALTVALFKALGLDNRSSPLGLPEGTVSALIALVLILLFGMIGIFVFLNGSFVQTSTGLTRDEVTRIDPSELLRVDCVKDSGGVELCSIDRVIKRDQASADIGKQLVTTVSTLVVAIASFYFGSTQFGRGKRSLTAASEHITEPERNTGPDTG